MKERWRKLRCFFGYHPEFSVVKVSVIDKFGDGSLRWGKTCLCLDCDRHWWERMK